MNVSSLESKRGRVVDGLPYKINNRNSISIGSNPGCDVVIDGADCHHAELSWDDKEKAWFIYDNPAPGDTIVNGKSIDACRINENDWFDIAGVRIRFADGKLCEIDPDKPVGLRVTLRGVSATAGGEQRLDNISFQAEAGSFVALLGPSGCGKSTLIQRIAGLAPYEGEILFNGHDLRTEKDKLLQLVAYLPQEVKSTLYAGMTVREAMEDFARCHLALDVKPDFKEELKNVGLVKENGSNWDEVADKPVLLLSGGMMRRFALALALMRKPQLLLLDEPTAGLDPCAEREIMKLLEDKAKEGRTILCATHVLDSLDCCTDVLLLAPRGTPRGKTVGCSVFFGTRDDAKKKINAQDWFPVYEKLQGDGFPGDVSPILAKPNPGNLPQAVPSASFGEAFNATFLRLFRQLKHNVWLFMVMPLAIALVLAMACRSMFDEGGSIGTVCFCMTVAMFWLGLSGSVRSLVVERVPKRCLDKMRGLTLLRYFTAHVAFAVFTTIVQSLMFTVIIFCFRHHPERFAPAAFPMFWLVLALVGFVGASVGLLVSAFAKNEVRAVLLLPVVAIFALFLSKPVLESDGKEIGGLVQAIEYSMPTHNPQVLLETKLAQYRTRNPDTAAHSRNKSNFALLALGYPLVLLPLAFYSQKRREEQWDGR